MKKTVTNPVVLCYLKEVGMMTALDERGRKELEQHSRVRVLRHKRGETTEFSLGDSVYIIQEGQAFLSCLAPSGRKIILDTLREGDIFGDLGMQSHLEEDDCLFVEPEGKAVICEIPKTFFATLIEGQPQFAAQLVLSLNKKVNHLASQVGILLFANARTKLLLKLAQLAKGGQKEEGFTVLLHRITHQQLADMIGVHRETVSLLISEFVEKGIVKYEPGHRLLVARDKLVTALTS